MLALRRKEGHWVEITHIASGETIRVRVYNIKYRSVDLVFDDKDHNFTIERPERSLVNG